MLELDERYVITRDKWNWILNYRVLPEDADPELLKRLGKEPAKEERMKPIGFYGGLYSALLRYINCKLGDAVDAEISTSCHDLIKTIADTEERINQVLKDAGLVQNN